MNDSSENVGQDAILSHEFSSFPGGLIKLVNDSSEKVWGRFPTCPQQACGAGWKPAPHFFIVSGSRSRHERLLRKLVGQVTNLSYQFSLFQGVFNDDINDSSENQPRRNEEREEKT